MQIMTLVRRYLAVGWQHRWKALVLAWLVCLGGWAFVYSMPNQYRSSTRIYADADVILGQLLRGIAVDSAPASQVERLQRTLLSRPNLERVAASTGLDMRASGAAARDRLLEQLGRDVRITAQARNLFTITYTDTDGQMARNVVNALLTLFMEQAASNDRQQMENARSFVGQQIAVYETQLREAEQRRAEFRTRYLELLPSEASGGLSRLEQARTRLQNLTGELHDATVRRDALREQLNATPATLPSPSVAGGGGGGDSRVAQAERQLRDLRLQYTEQHPAVVAARNALSELRSAGPISSGRPTGGGRTASTVGPSNPAHDQLRDRVFEAESRIPPLERQEREERTQVDRLEALARTMPQLQAQYTNLDRDYNVLRRSYEELLERRESVQIAGAARTGADRVRLEIVDPPTIPTAPFGPNRPLFASGVLVGGIGAGVLLVFLLIQLDKSFYTVQDLRKLGLPVIGSISSTEPAKSKAGAMVAFAFSVGLLLIAYGAVTVAGQTLIARIPALVARFTA